MAGKSTLRVVSYRRVSTAEQHDSGVGLAAQGTTILTEVGRRGWRLTADRYDVASGRSMTGRQGLDNALAMLDRGEAQVLAVARLDRLSRSLLDFATLMERIRRKGWALVALDLGLDTTTPAGAMVANLVAAFSEYERRIIGQRTREVLAARKAAGARLGRPPAVPEAVVQRVLREREAGATLRVIAESLNADGVPTAHGGARWHPSTVRQVEMSARKGDGSRR